MTDVTGECVEFFLLWCQKLESVLVKADLKFLTDQFLAKLLATNPLTHARLIYITSDSHVCHTHIRKKIIGYNNPSNSNMVSS